MIDLLGSLPTMVWILPTNSGVLFKSESEASELLYLYNHHWFHPILFKPSALKHTEIFQLDLLCWMPSSTTSFSKFWRGVELHQSSAFLKNNEQLTNLLHSIQYLKLTKHICKINSWQLTHSTLYISHNKSYLKLCHDTSGY